MGFVSTTSDKAERNEQASSDEAMTR